MNINICKGRVAQSVRALVLYAKGRGFEPHHVHPIFL